MMNTAAAANEIKSNVGPEYKLADYEAEQEAEAQRQALNAAMFDYFFG